MPVCDSVLWETFFSSYSIKLLIKLFKTDKMKRISLTSTVFVIFALGFVASQNSTTPPWIGLFNFMTLNLTNTNCATPCSNGLVCRTRLAGFNLQCSRYGKQKIKLSFNYTQQKREKSNNYYDLILHQWNQQFYRSKHMPELCDNEIYQPQRSKNCMARTGITLHNPPNLLLMSTERRSSAGCQRLLLPIQHHNWTLGIQQRNSNMYSIRKLCWWFIRILLDSSNFLVKLKVRMIANLN